MEKESGRFFAGDWFFVNKMNHKDYRLKWLMLEKSRYAYTSVDVSAFRCKLKGNVHGKEGFEEGAFIITSYIKKITRTMGDYVITTESGSEYSVQAPWDLTQFYNPEDMESKISQWIYDD